MMDTIQVPNDARRDYTQLRTRAQSEIIDPIDASKLSRGFETGSVTLPRCLSHPIWREFGAQIAPLTCARIRFSEIPLLVAEAATAAKSHAFDFAAFSNECALVWFVEVKAPFAGEEFARHAEPAPPRGTQDRSESAIGRLRTERIADIQAAFGLSTQALSEILRISRPGLYKWLDPDQSIQLHQANRVRLDLMRALANEWASRTRVPLSTIAHERLASGQTVSELLAAESLDEPVVLNAFDELLRKLGSQPRTMEQRMSDAGFKRRPTHRSLPQDE